MEEKEVKTFSVKSLISSCCITLVGLGLVILAYFMNLNESMHKSAYIYVIIFFGALFFLVGGLGLYSIIAESKHLKKMSIRQMSVISIFSALSVVLYYFAKFNLPFFPSWLDIQFSDLPILIVSFMYGPVSGVLMVLVRFFCKLPGTSTAGVGELADVIICVTLVLVSGLIYKKHKTFKGAIIAMISGMLSGTIMACVCNWLILIPAYISIAGFPMAALVGSMNAYMGGVVNESNFMLYYIFVGVLPFNIFRYTLVFIITLLVYKKLHIFIEKITN